METDLSAQLATLGHPGRLAIFRLLMRRHPQRVPAGELAGALEIKPSTLSAHLGALMQAGLVSRERAGTSRRYAIRLAAVRGMIGDLVNDCCRGRADLCAPFTACRQQEHRHMQPRKCRVLFVCTGNSARSIFAETILRDAAGESFEVHSAGTRPYCEPNPDALEVLRQNGHDTSTLRAKDISHYQGPDAPVFDFVFTVCDRAANEACLPWNGRPVTAHWPVPDPIRAEGAEAERSLAFREAYQALNGRITAFAALPIGALDRIALQTAVDDIAREGGEAPA